MNGNNILFFVDNVTLSNFRSLLIRTFIDLKEYTV